MIAIVDYKAGNLTSVKLGFDALGIEAAVTASAADILRADRVVFPGVGAAGAAMRNLTALGLIEALRTVVRRGTPFLGICLGTQIIFEFSEEDGGVAAIGLIPGRVKLFRPPDPADKVPQIGWNSVKLLCAHPVFKGIENQSEFYFVHSYYPAPSEAGYTVGVTDYAGVTFAAVVGRANLVATQFHPEKSGQIGLRIFANFSGWDGTC
jgi:imidazole glycerol-phosphate synthase subunit HisH